MDVNKYKQCECIPTNIAKLRSDNDAIDIDVSTVLNGGYAYRFASFIAKELDVYGSVGIDGRLQAYANVLKQQNNLWISYWQSRLQ